MRLSRHRIRARGKGDLSITFTDEALTSYSGLELSRRFLDRLFVSGMKEYYDGPIVMARDGQHFPL